MADEAAPGDAFWRFSLDFYGRPGVSEACLALQDHHGLDVNLALYACWVGWSGGGRLAAAQLAAAEQRIASWRDGVTAPLRAARRALKKENVASLYGEAKALELAVEREAQRRLALAAPPRHSCSEDQRAADARANLLLYVGTGPAREAASPLLAALAPGP